MSFYCSRFMYCEIFLISKYTYYGFQPPGHKHYCFIVLRVTKGQGPCVKSHIIFSYLEAICTIHYSPLKITEPPQDCSYGSVGRNERVPAASGHLNSVCRGPLSSLYRASLGSFAQRALSGFHCLRCLPTSSVASYMVFSILCYGSSF